LDLKIDWGPHVSLLPLFLCRVPHSASTDRAPLTTVCYRSLPRAAACRRCRPLPPLPSPRVRADKRSSDGPPAHATVTAACCRPAVTAFAAISVVTCPSVPEWQRKGVAKASSSTHSRTPLFPYLLSTEQRSSRLPPWSPHPSSGDKPPHRPSAPTKLQNGTVPTP
jgi:hypothetical protein